MIRVQGLGFIDRAATVADMNPALPTRRNMP